MVTTKYLTMDEAAEQLGVEYKTIYRLVRSGELPAGRVGRIYRIAQSDIDMYFERQKQLVADAAKQPAQAKAARSGVRKCCVCGQELFSELSVAGQCQQCHGDICQACWSIKKIRYCPSHESPSTLKSNMVGKTASEIDSIAGTAGKSKARMTKNEIKAADQAKEAEVAQKIQALRQAGQTVVTGPGARLAEATFLRAFGQRLEQVDQLPDPLSGLDISLPEARVKHEIKSDKKSAGQGKDLPGNQTSRFVLRTGGWGKPKAGVVLEAQFLARCHRLAERGYDTEPIGQAELSAILNDLARAAKSKADAFGVIILASPTGWSDDARSLIAGPSSGVKFHDRNIAVVLWDIAADESVFDIDDARLRAYWPIIAPKRWALQKAECIRQIVDAMVDRNSLALNEAGKLIEQDLAWLRAGFVALAGEGKYLLDELADLGLVLSRK